MSSPTSPERMRRVDAGRFGLPRPAVSLMSMSERFAGPEGDRGPQSRLDLHACADAHDAPDRVATERIIAAIGIVVEGRLLVEEVRDIEVDVRVLQVRNARHVVVEVHID